MPPGCTGEQDHALRVLLRSTGSRKARHEQVRSIVKIVRANPDYGIARIRKLLETAEYGSHVLKDSVIKRELIRMKLDTQEKREAFAKRELPTWASYK